MSSLARPYWEAFKAKRWNDYIMDKSWGFGRFLGDFFTISVFLFHLFTWAQPGSQLIFLFYGWTVIIGLWAIYRYKKIKNTVQENSGV